MMVRLDQQVLVRPAFIPLDLQTVTTPRLRLT